MLKIIHIGFHKTGSTSLQAFLGLNQWRLAQAGILYPPCDTQSAARLTALSLGHNPATAHLNERMPHNALAYRLLSEALPDYTFPQVHDPMFPGDTALTLMAQTARAMQAQNLILCSEDFARLSLMAPTALARITDAFGADGTHLMANIRRPDQAIET